MIIKYLVSVLVGIVIYLMCVGDSFLTVFSLSALVTACISSIVVAVLVFLNSKERKADKLRLDDVISKTESLLCEKTDLINEQLQAIDSIVESFAKKSSDFNLEIIQKLVDLKTLIDNTTNSRDKSLLALNSKLESHLAVIRNEFSKVLSTSGSIIGQTTDVHNELVKRCSELKSQIASAEDAKNKSIKTLSDLIMSKYSTVSSDLGYISKQLSSNKLDAGQRVNEVKQQIEDALRRQDDSFKLLREFIELELANNPTALKAIESLYENAEAQFNKMKNEFVSAKAAYDNANDNYDDNVEKFNKAIRENERNIEDELSLMSAKFEDLLCKNQSIKDENVSLTSKEIQIMERMEKLVIRNR